MFLGRKNEQFLDRNIVKMRKFGGFKIMVWACFNSRGVGKLK